MIHLQHPMAQNSVVPSLQSGALSRTRLFTAVGAIAAMLVLSGCGTSSSPEGENPDAATNGQGTTSEPTSPANEEPSTEPIVEQTQQETCDWDSPKISHPAESPEQQEGELTEVLIGSWQHTHTDDGSGFEEVVNDHRYVFPAPDRMLYCQHVPGATEYAENAADIVLNGTVIELPGGKYEYTILAWDEDTVVWDNPVGGGYIYLLQRR